MRKRIILETQSALSISGSPALGNLNRTLDYIPGTVLRGALAEAYHRKHDNRRGDFQQLFCDDEVRYGNLYPIVHGTQRGSQPIPLTAYTCKRRQGFLGDGRSSECHGVRDLLIDLMIYQETQDGAVVPDKCGHPGACPAPLDRYTGFCSYSGGQQRYKSNRPHKRQLGRTAIADHTQSALYGSLHTLEALNEAQQFAGYIYVSNVTLANPLDDLVDSNPLLLGRGVSKGLGECHKDTFDNGNLFPDSLDLEQRLQQLNQEVQARFAQHGRSCLKAFFSLTCYSDIVLRDGFFRYQSVLNLGDLRRYLSLANQTLVDGFSPHSVHTHLRTVAGWNAAWRLPKEEALAMVKGSVFVYAKPAASDEERQQVLQQIQPALQELETNGVGERRAEGFGAVVVCNPFHWCHNASPTHRQDSDLWL